MTDMRFLIETVKMFTEFQNDSAIKAGQPAPNELLFVYRNHGVEDNPETLKMKGPPPPPWQVNQVRVDSVKTYPFSRKKWNSLKGERHPAGKVVKQYTHPYPDSGRPDPKLTIHMTAYVRAPNRRAANLAFLQSFSPEETTAMTGWGMWGDVPRPITSQQADIEDNHRDWLDD